jgi:IclR family transcriptional regulator, KDG regulon repressor
MALQFDASQPTREEYRGTAIDRALDLLEMLGVSNVGLTLSEVSRKLGIALSSAHRMLHALAARGYVQRDIAGHHFSLGPRAFEFASFTLEEVKLRHICFPHTERLARELGMPALTAVRRGGQAVVIDKWDFRGGGGSWVGLHICFHASALGKVLIAYLSDSELELLYRDRPLRRFTPNTICSLDALKVHLTDVKAKGFAVNNEEDNIGGKSIAAPVFNHVGGVIASICVSAPSGQIPDWRVPKLADKVMSAASDISRDLAM